MSPALWLYVYFYFFALLLVTVVMSMAAVVSLMWRRRSQEQQTTEPIPRRQASGEPIDGAECISTQKSSQSSRVESRRVELHRVEFVCCCLLFVEVAFSVFVSPARQPASWLVVVVVEVVVVVPVAVAPPQLWQHTTKGAPLARNVANSSQSIERSQS